MNMTTRLRTLSSSPNHGTRRNNLASSRSPFGLLPRFDGVNNNSGAQIESGNGRPDQAAPLTLSTNVLQPTEPATPLVPALATLPTPAVDNPLDPRHTGIHRTANRLSACLPAWKNLTNDRWVLQTVMGYSIPFTRTPYQWRIRRTTTPRGRPVRAMREAIQSLLVKGAITVVEPHPQHFISTLFLVEKGQGTGEFRPIINLKGLNRYLPKETFKMEGLHTARSLLRNGDFMMKLDLRDAYFAVPIHQDSRKYLRFLFEGMTFEFNCLPFGLSLAPRVFTRILRPVVAHLCSKGVRVVIYLDDLLLMHHQRDTLLEIFQDVLHLLSSLGFLVKLEKCSPVPTRRLVFLGAVIDTTLMSIALPEEQILRLQSECRTMLASQTTTLGALSSLLGRMSHAARTGVWIAPLHYRALQRQQASLFHRVGWRPNSPLPLTSSALEDLTWWLSPTLHLHNRQDISPPTFDLTVQTDASLRGWGATCNGKTTGGRWSVAEASLHINCLELKAAILALQSFLRPLSQPPRHILLEMDNTAAVAYVNRRGGTHSHSLSLLALDLWSFLLTTGSWVTARHLPGVLNVEVDAPDGRFPRHHTTIRCPTDRPLRIAPESSGASLCIAPPGPGSLRSGCLPPELEPVVLLHTPTSGAAFPHSTETTGRRGYSAADSPQLARTSLVCTYPVDADGCTLSASPGGEPIVAAVRPDSCPPTLAVPATDCMAVIRQTFRSAGYPSSVTDVLLASWSASTKKRYTGPWHAWCQWCASRDLCPVSAPVPDVLTFLAEMTTGKRLEYRTLAVYSSAISQGHLPVDGSRLGRLPVVVCFMKGLFRLRPPTPRLSSTWDVQRLLTFLATLEPLADLTLKLLSLKLAALLALTSSARAHELVLLDTAWASIKSDSWEFTLGEHTKVSRPGHPPRRIYLPAFPDNPAIYVVRTLLDYQARTATFRKSSRLLISFAKPYGAISSRTLSRWLRDCLRLANIEGPFTGHSTRSASTSATARMGLPLKLILEAADWSSAKTFHQFYQRPTNRGDFARAVLTALP